MLGVTRYRIYSKKRRGVYLIKGAVTWGFGIISEAQKWINRNRNRTIVRELKI